MEILDIVISIILFVIVFFIIRFYYYKITNVSPIKKNELNSNHIQSIIAEYSSQIENFNVKIKDLVLKVELIESQLSISKIQNHKNILKKHEPDINKQNNDILKYDVTDNVIVTNKLSDTTTVSNKLYSSYSQTTDQILYLLIQKPRTAREIQILINKTREHISRLMKKMYQDKLIHRDNNVKPFKYYITDEGRKQLTNVEIH